MRIFREVNPAGEGGQIFNISSSGGYNAQPNLAYYNAAKFGERLGSIQKYASDFISVFFYLSTGGIYRILAS